MRKLSWRAPALAAFVTVLAVLVSACSGGGGGGGNGGPLFTVTFNNVDTTTYANDGIVCLDVTVTGPAGQSFEMIRQYLVDGTSLMLASSQPPNAFYVTGGGPLATLPPLVFDGNGQWNGAIYWAAGSDLGFLDAFVQYCITVFTNLDPNNPNGPTVCSNLFNYAAGAPSQDAGNVPGAGGGVNNPGGAGRAAHTANNVRPTVGPGALKNVLLAGGINDAPPENAWQGVDRFDFTNTFNQASFPYSIGFSDGGGMIKRVLHASSFFLDPTTGLIKVLVTGGLSNINVPPLNAAGVDLSSLSMGGLDTATAQIYCFSTGLGGGEQYILANNMSVARWGHTATWCNDGRIVVIGGATGNGASAVGLTTMTIEIYDPVTDTWTTSSTDLGNWPTSMGCTAYSGARLFHTATLLPDGNILIFGGYDPNNPTLELPAEVYDPTSDTVTPVPCNGPLVGYYRIGHTATRLQNGWVLITGGFGLPGYLDSLVYKPETGVPGGGTFSTVPSSPAVAQHSATLLGSGQVLISGGVVGFSGFTNATFFYNPGVGNYGVFSPANPMSVARADHSSTAVDCGSVFIIGGRNGTATAFNYLNDVEFYLFSNAVPVVTNPMTSGSGVGGNLTITFEVTDANADGGYVYVRFRDPAAGGAWSKATIVSQIPSTAPGNYPNLQVFPGTYNLVWNYQTDGVTSGAVVEFEIIPVGAVLGTPVNFPLQVP